jgi:hypothetical protein
MANKPTFAQDKSLPDESSINLNREFFNVRPRKPKVEKLIQEGKQLERKSSEYARPPSLSKIYFSNKWVIVNTELSTLSRYATRYFN